MTDDLIPRAEVERVLSDMYENHCVDSAFGALLSYSKLRQEIAALPTGQGEGDVWRPVDDAAKTGEWMLLRRAEDHDALIVAQWEVEGDSRWRWVSLDGNYHESAFDEYRPVRAALTQTGD